MNELKFIEIICNMKEAIESLNNFAQEAIKEICKDDSSRLYFYQAEYEMLFDRLSDGYTLSLAMMKENYEGIRIMHGLKGNSCSL
jgi:hypothetical protein